MRLALVFPPLANPTYVPLGLASLVSYLKANAPKVELSAHDLNISTWRELAMCGPESHRLWDFLQGKDGNFFDQDQYNMQMPAWANLSERMWQLHAQAKVYLRTGCCPEELAGIVDRFLNDLIEGKPDVVGFSVMFPDQFAFAVAMTHRMCELAGHKKVGDRAAPFKIVLGGAATSTIDVDELLNASRAVDAVLPGEGELALERLCHGVPLEQIPGVRMRGVQVQSANTVLPVAPGSLTTPDFSVFDPGAYANPDIVLPVALSRGCAWNRCRFCAHNFSFDSHRQKEVIQFVDEIELLIGLHGAQHFYLVDQYVPAVLLEQLSDEILRRGLKVHFQVMARPTADYTPARLAKAASAGCCWISWGVETGSQRLLNLVCKGTKRHIIEKVMVDSHRAGIANLMMMIFGLPTSTHDDLLQTFDMIEQVYPDVDAITSSSFVLFEGTDFARRASRYGLSITGRSVILEILDKPVHSHRLTFVTKASDGSITAPTGAFEVSWWTNRRRWFGEIPFIEKLCCEHFLLYSASNRASNQHHPQRPLPRRVA